ncbi:EARP-interacting protein homolog [Homalodisca vitripennis]|uniref:EIPR1-like beta-propeller domain-containing protein n=1 Tax=Homalodisca liturata TaxID=320908 RepID=A0A1B6JMN9_9HEMI|nr:EARP-interacting protein homolog [Homalodisca vitripennis]KAG8311912.1 Protein tssc1 [Homalodisca vitripennis]
MEEENNLISLYGLEFPSRAVSAQVAETDVVRFLVGTQTLKLANNQVHLVELNDDTGAVNTKVYQHGDGEIWSLTSSPSDAHVLSTCYNTIQYPEGNCVMRTALWRLPESDDDCVALERLCSFDTEPHGENIKVTAFNPLDGKQAATVVDNKFLVWDLGQDSAQLISVGTMQGKGNPKLTTGKWNPQHSGLQFTTASDCSVRGWDLRAGNKQAWVIENAHAQLVRDLDFNPNRQYYLGTCGDDGCSKFWDFRKPGEAIISRSDHSHWVWCLRYNHFHDQLVVTSSSDCVVLLTSVASIASEPIDDDTKVRMEDGVLATYDQHEDSVYCVEWSSADPWCFASLSYDGRLLLNRVPKSHKYNILI